MNNGWIFPVRYVWQFTRGYIHHHSSDVCGRHDMSWSNASSILHDFGCFSPRKKRPIQRNWSWLVERFRILMFYIYYISPLVNCHITKWKDPPMLFMGKLTTFRLGHGFNSKLLYQRVRAIPIGHMVTFTINIHPMLAYIPYMDPMGYGKNNWIWPSTPSQQLR